MRLHGYFRSGASWRVRIALNLKSLSVTHSFHHLRRGEQRAPTYLALNPQGLVPALELEDGTVLTQSMAIIEWLDETYPTPALLPLDKARTTDGGLPRSWRSSKRSQSSRARRLWPNCRGASVEITFASGQPARETVDIAEGDAQRPLPQASLERKFMNFAVPVVSSSAAERIVSLVENLDHVGAATYVRGQRLREASSYLTGGANCDAAARQEGATFRQRMQCSCTNRTTALDDTYGRQADG